MKRICLVISIFLVSCLLAYAIIPAEQDSEQTVRIKIGVSMNDEYDTFLSEVSEQISILCHEKEEETGIRILVDVVCANGSQLTQNNQIEEFANQEYDVVCVNLVNRTNPSVIIDTAQNANIPIIFFNREPVKEDLERWNKIYYVGTKAEEAGKMQGEILLKALEERYDEIDLNSDGVLQYVILEGETVHKDALLRSEYVVRTIEDAGYKLQKLDGEFANWKRDQAKSKMQELWDQYSHKIELIIANNDAMALGAIDALNLRDVDHWPIILGVDGIEEALGMVKDQVMLGTVYNDAVGQASAIVELAYSLALNQSIPKNLELVDDKYILLPYQIINYDNVKKFLKDER